MEARSLTRRTDAAHRYFDDELRDLERLIGRDLSMWKCMKVLG